MCLCCTNFCSVSFSVQNGTTSHNRSQTHTRPKPYRTRTVSGINDVTMLTAVQSIHCYEDAHTRHTNKAHRQQGYYYALFLCQFGRFIFLFFVLLRFGFYIINKLVYSCLAKLFRIDCMSVSFVSSSRPDHISLL